MVELLIYMDIFSIDVKNGLSDKKLRKKIDKEIRKAIAQGRVSYTWKGKPVND